MEQKVKPMADHQKSEAGDRHLDQEPESAVPRALAGTLAGGAAGALAGSVAGPVGAVIGTAIGGLAGAVAGGAVSGVESDTDSEAEENSGLRSPVEASHPSSNDEDVVDGEHIVHDETDSRKKGQSTARRASR